VASGPAPAAPPPAGAANPLACFERLVQLHCATDYFVVYPDRCRWHRQQLAQLRTAAPDEQTRRELWCLDHYGQLSSTARIELRRYFRGRKPPTFKDDHECVRRVRDLVCGPAYQAIERASCVDWTRKATALARLSPKDRGATAYLCLLDYNGLTDQVAHALRTRAASPKAP
jgi:hypothetical protein